ncbi:MAG: glycerol-3-phosphate acyltransferase [Desulfobacterales bacterium]|nr:glycerol-3-phosphate acyltransferase [Desulfobacterales bacterium]
MKLFILIFAGAYALASINFSILLFKALGKNDPRNEFSGNPGAFNVYRILGLYWALPVLLLDVCRAMGVALISTHFLAAGWIPWVGFGLILGNRFPCFHRFQGGKGVANYLGFSMVLAPLSAAASVLAWIITYMIFRIAFVGSFVMVFILGTGTLLFYDFHPLAATGVIASVALIFYSHKANIKNLRQSAFPW